MKHAAGQIHWKGFSFEQKRAALAKLHEIHADICRDARAIERLMRDAKWAK